MSSGSSTPATTPSARPRYEPEDFTLTMRVCSSYTLLGADPTVHLRGRLIATSEDEVETLLAEVAARRFIPGRLHQEIGVNDRDGGDQFDLHDSHDQDTHELWGAIYDRNGHDFNSTWSANDTDLKYPFGNAVVIDPILPSIVYDNEWIELVLMQAFLDEIEDGDLGVTLVDMRPDQTDPEGTGLGRARQIFAKLGFKPRRHVFDVGHEIEFLFRCPERRHPRARFSIWTRRTFQHKTERDRVRR